jgi:hypothetical protein
MFTISVAWRDGRAQRQSRNRCSSDGSDHGNCGSKDSPILRAGYFFVKKITRACGRAGNPDCGAFVDCCSSPHLFSLLWVESESFLVTGICDEDACHRAPRRAITEVRGRSCCVFVGRTQCAGRESSLKSSCEPVFSSQLSVVRLEGAD